MVFPVTTDSVLLGSWVRILRSQNILDLGCGSGVLSLMLAQRAGPGTRIYGIDVDQYSVDCCQENIKSSPWSQNVYCFQIGLTELVTDHFFSSMKSAFQQIVSNPPYYKNQLKSDRIVSARSKHQNQFDFKLLSDIVHFFLAEEGSASFVIPYSQEEELSYQMYNNSLQLNRMMNVRHYQNSENNLILLEYSRSGMAMESNEMVLFDQNGTRTKEFDQLTKAYYL